MKRIPFNIQPTDELLLVVDEFRSRLRPIPRRTVAARLMILEAAATVGISIAEAQAADPDIPLK